jgi:signal transduction histidine kinase/CheY-like chemotaxis protein
MGVSKANDFNSEAFKLKNVSKRTSELGFISTFLSVGVALYYYSLGLGPSAIMVGCFSFSVGIILTLYTLKIVKHIQKYIFLFTYALLIVSARIEGSTSGQYFYFFPIFVVIPIIFEYKKSLFGETGLFFSLTIIAFAANLYIGNFITPIESIPAAVAKKMFFTNEISAALLTVCFSLAYIYYERLYLSALTSQKNAAISARTKFLSTMGHELRTPLNGMIGALSILKDEEPSLQQNEYFQILKYCSHHMQQLVNDILDFNKIEAGKLEVHPVEVNLKQLLLNSILPFYNHIEEKNLKLKVKIDPRLDTMVLLDDVRLIQILNNLISNALKFTERGYLKIDVECKSIDENIVDVNFSVEDTGIGIEKHNQERIFESFWQVYDKSTRSNTGTGLGLTICIRLLNLMNSHLKLVSEKDVGSTFSFNLVLNRCSNATTNIENTPNNVEDLSGIRILIVEDNQINMIISRKMLTGFKAECIAAYNGREALDILEKDAAFDIILLDLEMPIMDGYAAEVEINKLYPQIPVVAFTASLVDQEMLSGLMALGFKDCLLKPFQPQQLLAIVDKHIKRKASAVE